MIALSVMVDTGKTPVIASDRMSVALINASVGVRVGIVRYLCLKNTKLQTRAFGVDDVDIVAMVVLQGIADVVTARSVRCPSLPNFRENMSFDFASKWCKWVAVVVVLSVEVCVG